MPKHRAKVVKKDDETEDKESFEPVKHVFVPQHEILKKNDAEEIMARYNARPDQMPFISVNDPVIRSISAQPGDLVRITRRSETSGEAFYYRYVVEE
ncbi:MAG: DNA-directed RNA polymerase subunit H [Nitrososphaerales archaeon]